MTFEEKFNEKFKASPFGYGFGFGAIITGVMGIVAAELIKNEMIRRNLDITSTVNGEYGFIVWTILGIIWVIYGIYKSVRLNHADKETSN
jgi:hypothetical protein